MDGCEPVIWPIETKMDFSFCMVGPACWSKSKDIAYIRQRSKGLVEAELSQDGRSGNSDLAR